MWLALIGGLALTNLKKGGERERENFAINKAFSQYKDSSTYHNIFQGYDATWLLVGCKLKVVETVVVQDKPAPLKLSVIMKNLYEGK
jgi:hypothetical protein